VRGFRAGTVKKKGYTVINSKEGNGERVYRVASENAQAAPASVVSQDNEKG